MAASKYLLQYLYDNNISTAEIRGGRKYIFMTDKIDNTYRVLAEKSLFEERSMKGFLGSLSSTNMLEHKSIKGVEYYFSISMILDKDLYPILYKDFKGDSLVDIYIDFRVFQSDDPVEKMLSKAVKDIANSMYSLTITDLNKLIKVRKDMAYKDMNHIINCMSYGAEQESSKCDKESSR